jgi:cytochrome c
MDSFELNKIIGAVLGTLLFVMGVGFLAEAIYHPIEGRGPGLTLAEAEVAGEHGAGPAEPEAPAVPLGVLLASADAAAGQASVKKCSSCHNFGEGESNKTGPGLYGVVDRLIGSHEGFAYSAGMEEHRAKGDLWSYENLDAFLTSPKAFTPGTKMSFAGVKDPAERANILAYLQTLSPAPVPFPAAEAVPAAAPAEGAAAPAEGAAPAEAGATEGAAVETPSTTASETPVEGTPAPATTEAPAASH